ncbi:conserved membrane protein of unknown function [Methanocaldococcus lauensis]|uniref:Uncharacterized protein n=1 Tax=Methanocaldococcus lauensis TaxID=2546128 RepID=A0A8D6PX79_9EURY|nr:DUF4013 domain-containing protein [Methanocaldococcus lauensis]CAB3289100.1 conserved membrane protein of unknown function [Methanocaldococcus lauensis]
MRKLEDYISDAFRYAFSDIKKGLVGGLLYAISGALSVFVSIVIEPGMMEGVYLEKFTTLLILSSIGFLIGLIVGFLVDGYYIRVMKTTVEGSNTLPEWNNISDLLVKGFLYTIGTLILVIIFMLPLIILFIIGIFAMAIDSSGIIGLPLLLISLLLMILLIILFILYSYLAEVNFSVKGFFGFFEFKKIFKLMSLKYVVLLILVVIITVIVLLIVSSPFIIVYMLYAAQTPSFYYEYIPSTPMIIIKLISTIVSSFVGFFMEVFSKRAIALYYKDKIEELE